MKTFTNFKFQMDTEIVFGRDTESKVGALVKKYGGSKVMAVYGGGSVKRSGLLDRVTSSLKEAGIDTVEFGGVRPNPRRSFVEDGILLAKNEKPDFYLGLGGGSAIDTAKALALAAANDWTYWQFWNGIEPLAMAPVGSIHTLAAAGSETSRSSVLVDDMETGLKKGFDWDVCRPRFAIMNPELTYTLPDEQTAAGAVDVFAHTFMRYFAKGFSWLGDRYAAGTLKTVVKYAGKALENPKDYEARAELMLAGSFSHNDLTGIGKEASGKGGEHPLEHQLSGTYDTPHGAGLSVMMPALLEYILHHGNPENIARVAQFGVDVFNIDPEEAAPAETAKAAIAALKTWLLSIDMPITLKGLGVPKDDIDAAISRCVTDTGGMINGYMPLDSAAIDEIYRRAYDNI